jgi:8-oxo-dGTP pyrophosphatase MutT (NUDIX family)
MVGEVKLIEEKKHFVTATGIVVKDGKYLIAKRAGWEKAFPNRWTVPGGKLEAKDYASRAPDAGVNWYNVIESLVLREVKEETSLGLDNLNYLTSLAFIRSDGVPCVIISMFGDYVSGEVNLCKALTEYAWVTLEESKKYDLIEGIYEELEMLDVLIKTGRKMKWAKK